MTRALADMTPVEQGLCVGYPDEHSRPLSGPPESLDPEHRALPPLVCQVGEEARRGGLLTHADTIHLLTEVLEGSTE